MTAGGFTRSVALAIVANVAIVAIWVGPAHADAPPDTLISGEPARGGAIDQVFKLLELKRLGCKFTEEKRVALLARPLKSTGTIYFDRDKGIARTTLTPNACSMRSEWSRVGSGSRTVVMPCA